jgi:hypothetical protein
MADYQIICVDRIDSATPPHHQHIVRVGVPGGEQFGIQEAWAAIDHGHQFHTISPTTRVRAEVKQWTCEHGVRTLRSSPDAEIDNNLDYLDHCP